MLSFPCSEVKEREEPITGELNDAQGSAASLNPKRMLSRTPITRGAHRSDSMRSTEYATVSDRYERLGKTSNEGHGFSRAVNGYALDGFSR
jgi:hypothetical protein